MGNLHRGHLELIKIGKLKSNILIISIFINPAQFSNSKDFRNYPKTLNEDIKKLIEYKVDILFCPTLKSMYPFGYKNHTLVNVVQYSSILDGKTMSNHFIGVATIISKLFNLINPDIAIFGQKDFQQLIMIRQLVLHMNYNIKILSAPIIRCFDGLALSSRNRHLSLEERKKAPKIYNILLELSKKIKLNKLYNLKKDYDAILKNYLIKLNNYGFKVEVLSIRNAKNLMPIDENSKQAVILCSAKIGSIRLVDNIKIKL